MCAYIWHTANNLLYLSTTCHIETIIMKFMSRSRAYNAVCFKITITRLPKVQFQLFSHIVNNSMQWPSAISKSLLCDCVSSGELLNLGSTLTPSDTPGLHATTSGLAELLYGIIVVSVTVFCFISFLGCICFRVYGRSKLPLIHYTGIHLCLIEYRLWHCKSQ